MVLAWDGKLVLGHAPSNWAEELSLIIVIASMTGIGALSLALNQGRLARHHRHNALTDPLTGLLNRRALFDLHGDAPVGAFTAVVVFDLDNFKAINDEFGHATGDEVLKVFAKELAGNLRPADVAARMGGEEFALVLKRTLPETVEDTAERIRAAFAARRIETETGSLTCTVSAGFAFGSQGRHQLRQGAQRRRQGALRRQARRPQPRHRLGIPPRRLSLRSESIWDGRRPLRRHDHFVEGIEIDIENLGDLLDQLVVVVALRPQDVDGCDDVDALGKPSLLVVLDVTFHGCPLACVPKRVERQTDRRREARKPCLRGTCPA